MFSIFGGGIHPPEHKSCTKDLKFINLPIPHLCYIPLQQHIGAPARPVVNKGDIVSEGQLIGSAQGAVSANVHASIPGKVVDITDIPTIYDRQKAVVVEAEGSFIYTAFPQKQTDWKSLGGDEIKKMIGDAGIVGHGGVSFPSAVKLSPPPEKKIETLIINGTECEPYLTADDMLMQTAPDAILEGTRIIMKALDVTSGSICVGSDKKSALRALEQSLTALNPSESITIKELKTKYPQGAEKQLIYSVLGKEVQSGSLPSDVGVIVLSVATTYAIYEAVVYGRALFMQYITVSGGAIAKPGNYKVRIGTRISDIVDECGGFKKPVAKIIMGGPLRGISVCSMDVPVVKGTAGILFLTDKEVSVRNYSACIRCGKCVAVCPAGLLPCLLGNAVEKGRLETAKSLNPHDCILCGSCSYVCPAGRPLSYFFKVAQERIREQKM